MSCKVGSQGHSSNGRHGIWIQSYILFTTSIDTNFKTTHGKRWLIGEQHRNLLEGNILYLDYIGSYTNIYICKNSVNISLKFSTFTLIPQMWKKNGKNAWC